MENSIFCTSGLLEHNRLDKRTADPVIRLTDALLEQPSLAPQDVATMLKLHFAQASIEDKLAAKLFSSARFIRSVAQDKRLRIGVVLAMWGEQNRLHPQSADNPHGEDSLRQKVAQLEWICRNSPIEWRLYLVDDGCPHASGALAQKIASSLPQKENISVLHLSQALPAEHEPLSLLKSADDSRKGGAIVLGAQQALEDGVDAVILTDADNSVHLGQIGLLIKPYLESGRRVVLGDRKHPDSVLVKQENRWGDGIKLLRHMQRMVGQAVFSQGITDTQAAFKLLDALFLSTILPKIDCFHFAIDTDLICATLAYEEAYAQVPFAFIDSFAESASITQGPMSTWEFLLKGIAHQVQKYNLPHNAEMADIILNDIQSSATLDLLIDDLPPELANAADAELGNAELMPPAAVRSWIAGKTNR